MRRMKPNHEEHKGHEEFTNANKEFLNRRKQRSQRMCNNSSLLSLLPPVYKLTMRFDQKYIVVCLFVFFVVIP